MMDGIWVGNKYIKNSGYVTTYCVSFTNMTSYYVSKPEVWKLEMMPVFGPMLHTAPVILAFWSDEE
jgi:uncharacterized membrane protein